MEGKAFSIYQRYPHCASVLKELTDRYGRPQQIRSFSQDGTEGTARTWTNETERLSLVCVPAEKEHGTFALEITIAAEKNPTRKSTKSNDDPITPQKTQESEVSSEDR